MVSSPRPVENRLSSILNDLANGVFRWLEARSHWLKNTCFVSLFLSVLGILGAFPDYHHFRPYASTPWAEAAMNWKYEHPLERIPVATFAINAQPGESGIAEHLNKRNFRVAIPWLAKLTGIGMLGSLLLQQCTSVLFIALFYASLRRLWHDDIAAFLGSAALATGFIGQWGFVDTIYFDGFAWFLMLLGYHSQRPWLIALITAFSGFVDERAILALPLLYLLYQASTAPTSALSWWQKLRPSGASAGLLVGAALFGVLRWRLGVHMGVYADTAGMGFGPLKYNLSMFPLASILVFEGWALLVAAAVVALIASGRYALIAFIGVAMLPVLIVAALVYDFSRSLGYLFPLMLICAHQLVILVPGSIRKLSLGAAIFSLFLPCYYILLGLHIVMPLHSVF